MMVEENREWLYWKLVGFQQSWEFEKIENPETPIGVFANKFLDSEIAMEKGMKEYCDYLNEIKEHNKTFLRRIKKVMGKTFHKYLLEIIENSEGARNKIEFVKTPVGKYQKESYGKTIKGIWVDQWSLGDSGDSWEGYVCVPLKENKFLKFSYSM